MANTYSQLYVHAVFTVKDHNSFIAEPFREQVEKYICGIVSNNKCKPLAIYCNPDHTHLLVGIHPAVAVSDLVRDVKASSSKYIHESLGNQWFEWQTGFGAFTYSRSQIDRVIKYILHQPEHHKKQSFKDEYLSILRKAEIEYDERYLFRWFDNDEE